MKPEETFYSAIASVQNLSNTQKLQPPCPARVEPIALTKMAAVQALPGSLLLPTEFSHLLISNPSFLLLAIGRYFLMDLVEKQSCALLV